MGDNFNAVRSDRDAPFAGSLQRGDPATLCRYNASMQQAPPLTAAPLAELRVCIAGLGLMGGSLALALRGHVAHLVGVEPQPAPRIAALRDGIVDSVTDDFGEGVAKADLVVLAAPVHTIIHLLGQLPAHRPDGCLVLDLGSTKQAVVTAMDELPPTFDAIGGHPMCGKETPGLPAASADLYHDQTFVLCRSQRTTEQMERTALALIDIIGSRPVWLDATTHDDIVAAVSHVPYLLSAALMRVVAGEEQWAISAGGFRDTSRLSGSSPRMMGDILQTNRAAVLAALQAVAADLARVEALLAAGDDDGLADWLAEAQVRHAAYRRFHASPPPDSSGPDTPL